MFITKSFTFQAFTLVICFLNLRCNSYLLKARRAYPNLSLRSTVAAWRDKLDVPPDVITSAVEKQNRLSVSDAATLAGVDLTTAKKGLTTLATLTGGDLDVTNSGDIVYNFPPNFKEILLKRSLGQQLRSYQEFLFPKLYWLTRVSFGLTLLTSLVIIGGTFILISSSSNKRDDDDERSDSNQQSYSYQPSYYQPSPFSMLWYYNPLDTIFYSRPYYAYEPDYYQSSDEMPPQQMGFLESIYSFVFGDGNPNEGFENEQLRAIAAKIRERKGVVFAEELAPLLDPPALPSESSTAVVDEAWVLPAVLQLQGEPVVTENGDICYKFPDLTASATQYFVDDGDEASNRALVAAQSGTALLQEKTIPFSGASQNQILIAAILGVANFVGVFWLGSVISNAVYAKKFPVLIAVLSKLFPALVAYASIYFIVPAVRTLKNNGVNAEIERRNERRRQWLLLLQSQSALMKAKKAAADKLVLTSSVGPRVLGGSPDDIAFTTRGRDLD